MTGLIRPILHAQSKIGRFEGCDGAPAVEDKKPLRAPPGGVFVCWGLLQKLYSGVKAEFAIPVSNG